MCSFLHNKMYQQSGILLLSVMYVVRLLCCECRTEERECVCGFSYLITYGMVLRGIDEE